jgi:hypothetical protein
MRFDRRRLALFNLAVVLCLTAAAVSARAQPPESQLPAPQLYTVFPPGGKAGSTFEATFTGVDLEEPQNLYFSQPGIKAEPIIPPAPKPDPKADPKKPPPPRPPVTQFKVSIAADTPLGIHDVRLVNKWGVSNPRAFTVGDLPEVVEKESNDDVPQAQRIAINTTVNGTIGNPVDIDYYVFAGKKGQRVVVSCLASSIDSRLTAGLDFFDASGHKLAQNRNYQGNDALVDCTLPADGDYYVRVYEFTHTEGSPEHFYRLSVTTAPWIDAITPPMIEPGKTSLVTIYGRNLPGGKLDPLAVENGSTLEKLQAAITAPPIGEKVTHSRRIVPHSADIDGFEYRIKNDAGVSNPFFLSFARAPVTFDNEANDTSETAQTVVLPCEIAGRIEKRRDRDWYTFAARKDEVYNIEVLSDRIGCDTDMYFVLRRADNKQVLVENDDNPDTLSPVRFFTHSEDPPTYRFVAPADGKYELMVSSRDSDIRFGPRLFYRVRIAPEHPDFYVVLLPSTEFRPGSGCFFQGGNELYAAYIGRHEGFTGPVTLTAERLPPGVTCPPQTIGANLRQGAFTISAAPSAWHWTGAIHVKASATINGQTIVHDALAATITWPVPPATGIPAVSRLDRGLVLAVRGQAPFHLSATPEKVALLQGGKVNVGLKLTRLWPDFKTPLSVVPTDPPTDLPPGLVFGNNNQAVNMNPGKDEETVAITAAANVPVGTYNIVLRGTAQVPFNKDPKAAKANINALQPAEAFALTVLPAQVATLSVDKPNLTLKPGTQQELIVRVARQQGYTGEFKVELVLPANTKGIAAVPVTIPAGKDEIKLVLSVAGDAALGNHANLVVRAVAILQGDVPANHETKINVNVVK